MASYYASKKVTVVDMSQTLREPDYGSYILTGSRANPGIQSYLNDVGLIMIRRDDAVFCTINVKTK